MEKKCPHCKTVLLKSSDILGLTKLINDTIINNAQIVTLDAKPLICDSCGYIELELRDSNK